MIKKVIGALMVIVMVMIIFLVYSTETIEYERSANFYV